MAVGPFGPAAGKTRPCMRASGDVARYCGPATARLSAFPGVLFRNGSCAQRRTGLALERVPGYPTHVDFDETGFNSEAAWDSDISCTCAHFVSSVSHGGLMNVRPTPSDRLANLEERYRQPWRTTDRLWEGDGVLILGRPERAHSVWLFRDGGDFAGWYVNLEEPWRPCRVGFDTADHELDLWIDRDYSWRWKDEQELDALVKQGHFSPEQAAKIRAEGERVIAEWPFPTGWEDWRADPSWPVPRVPGDWQA